MTREGHPLRIAMLAKTLPFSRVTQGGGVDWQVHYVANEMVRRGHRVCFFSSDRAPPGALYEVREVPVPRFVLARKMLHLFLYGCFYRRIDFSGFDVVHAHGDDTFLRPGPPVVRTFYGSSLSEAAVARTWKRRLGCLALYLLEFVSAQRAAASVGISRETRARLPFVRHQIPTGVDLERFRPGRERSPRPTILFVGTRAGRKRGDLLFRVFESQVRVALPEAELVLVTSDGPGEESPGVTWLERVTGERLVELYQSAWIFCLPSTYEGFGVPYIEAMACGTPVVSTPNPGAREVLEAGRFGLVVPAHGLGRALVVLLQDEARRAELARLGLERARSYAMGEVARRYEEVYRHVVARRRHG